MNRSRDITVNYIDNDLGLAMWRFVLVICDVMFVYYYMDMYLDADECLVESVEIDFNERVS